MNWLMLMMLLQAASVFEQPVSDGELARQRGGIRLSNGLDIAVTVQTQTAVNGSVVLRTVHQIDQSSTLVIYAPEAGQTVTQEKSSESWAGPPVGTPTVSFDRSGGIRVIPGSVAAPAVLLSNAAKTSEAIQAGLVEVTPGSVTDAGVVTENAANGVRSVSLTSADLTITHLAGNALGSAIINSGSDRTIDTETTIAIDLGNFSPDVLGSAMLRVQDIAGDAVASRVGG